MNTLHPAARSFRLLPFGLLSLIAAGCAQNPIHQVARPANQMQDQRAPTAYQATTECNKIVTISEDDRNNTLFVHPGLLFVIDWGGDRAKDAGLMLARDGFGADIMEVRSRSGEPIRQRMLANPGQRFIGIHYSTGGSPAVLAGALAATQAASHQRGHPLVYSPVMVEPSAFDTLLDHVDLDSPHLGQMVIFISSQHALLRPPIENVPPALLEHPKIHVLYAEELGLSWSHFSFLSDFRESHRQTTLAARRARELFHTAVHALLDGSDSAKLEGILAGLKLRYADEDDRPSRLEWQTAHRRLDCGSGSDRTSQHSTPYNRAPQTPR